jgi:hypothetical protein
MSPPIHRDRTAVRFWLGLAALGCGFVGIAASNSQGPPVITNPGDLRFLSANTSFAPGALNPVWRVRHRCPPRARLLQRLRPTDLRATDKFTPLAERF